MADFHVHAPDVSEIGLLWGLNGEELTRLEGRLPTQFAFATTAGQPEADAVLKDAGWHDVGHRYNQYHGPRFVTLWLKEFTERTEAAVPDEFFEGYMAAHAPPYGAFGCGIWFAQVKWPEPRLLETKWLSLLRLSAKPEADQVFELVSNGWKHFADGALGSSLWHTAEPHDAFNKYGRL